MHPPPGTSRQAISSQRGRLGVRCIIDSPSLSGRVDTDCIGNGGRDLEADKSGKTGNSGRAGDTAATRLPGGYNQPRHLSGPGKEEWIMPIHDWTRVEAGIFHDFHHGWIADIKRALNAGVLPPNYYA